MAIKFPFDSVIKSTVKIRHAPIVWKLREDSSPNLPIQELGSAPAKQRKEVDSSLQVRLDCQPHWFRPPPKMRIVPRILGSCPIDETRGANPF
jgi:hypothetical protein